MGTTGTTCWEPPKNNGRVPCDQNRQSQSGSFCFYFKLLYLWAPLLFKNLLLFTDWWARPQQTAAPQPSRPDMICTTLAKIIFHCSVAIAVLTTQADHTRGQKGSYLLQARDRLSVLNRLPGREGSSRGFRRCSSGLLISRGYWRFPLKWVGCLPVIVCRMDRKMIEKREAKLKSLHESMQHDHLFKVCL